MTLDCRNVAILAHEMFHNIIESGKVVVETGKVELEEVEPKTICIITMTFVKHEHKHQVSRIMHEACCKIMKELYEDGTCS